MSATLQGPGLKPGSIYCNKVHDRWYLYLDHLALPLVEIIHIEFDATCPASANCVEIVTAHHGIYQVIDEMADHLRGLFEAPLYDTINEKDYPTQVFVQRRPHGVLH